jgi:hypothetical protein
MTSVAAASEMSEARVARRERLRLLLRSLSFLIGAGVLLFWLTCALFGSRITPYDPIFETSNRAFPPYPFTRAATLLRVLRSRDILLWRRRDAPRHGLRDDLGLSPDTCGIADDTIGYDAVLAIR